MIRKRLLLLVPAAVVFAAAVSGTAAVVGDSQNRNNTSCARTAVELSSGDGDSNSVDIVVLVSGSSSTSISQQVRQFGGHVEVDIDVTYDGGSVVISGESVENGTLELEVTRDDTVVNESVVVDGRDIRALVFHMDSDGEVRISREDDSVYETDGGRSLDCSESVPCPCSDSTTELSPPPERSSVESGPRLGVMRVVSRTHELVGLGKPGRAFDCGAASGESTADCASEP